MNNNHPSSPAAGEQLTFDIPMKDLDSEIVELAYMEASLHIQSQFDSIRDTQHLIQTILGWLLAAILSLSGILTGQLTGEHHSALAVAMTALGIIALGFPAILMWRGALYKTSHRFPGTPPAYFLDKPTVSWLRTLEPPDRLPCKKYQHLLALQNDSERNAALIRRMRDAYRSGVKWLAIDMALFLITLVALLAAGV